MSYIQVREEIKNRPTTEGWELEIRRMLLGERAVELLRVGGAEEYIAILIAESRDKALAETTFRYALRTVVQECGPQEWRSPAGAACLLDLIGAYLPGAGFGKIIELLASPIRLSIATTELYPNPGDLHFKAIVVLGEFIPAAPVSEDSRLPFKAYINTIRGYLPSSNYAGYAIFRLLELGFLDTTSHEFINTIQVNHTALEKLVEYLVTPIADDRIHSLLSNIYIQCIRLGDRFDERFRTALEKVDGRMFDGDNGPIIRLPSGSEFLLEIPWAEKPLITDYMEERHINFLKAGEVTIDQIVH